jgi:hypothetical protein
MTINYLIYWELFVTGEMRLGTISVTETECIVMGIHTISAIFGSNIWISQVRENSFITVVTRNMAVFEAVILRIDLQ